MITRTQSTFQPDWQSELRNAVSDRQELLGMLGLQHHQSVDPFSLAGPGKAAFPLRVPLSYVARMRKGDPDDPLLRQVLPLAVENQHASDFSRDPVGDLQSVVSRGVLHKYQGRALLVTTGACAVHCRYCFRQHFPYSDSTASSRHWADALDYIRGEQSVREVILSGGDPLSLTDSRLRELVSLLEAIPHVKTLRIHTRMPVVLPRRIDNQLLDWIGHARLRTVMVIHANHANELNDDVARAMQRLSAAGTVLLNQSVLLRGINDTVSALAGLSERLLDTGVLPYYLHLLDRVQGASHFEVDKDTPRQLMEGLRRELPGYLVPRLVREQAGAPYKVPVL